MDAKVTLSFNAAVIKKAKDYAESQGLSLSRLTELLLKKVIATGQHENIEHIPIDCGNDEAVLAACDKKVKDFEDGLQYYSALHAGCSCIVTENTADFYFSSIDVLSAQDFLLKCYRK